MMMMMMMVMSTIVYVSTADSENDGDDGDDGDEHHRVRVNLDGLCGDMCKSSESFCLQSNLLRCTCDSIDQGTLMSGTWERSTGIWAKKITFPSKKKLPCLNMR